MSEAVSIQQATSRAEHELLLCCVRPDEAGETIDRIRGLAAKSIDWDYLFLLARRHAVVPLLYVHLRSVATNLIPVDHLQRLRKYFEENAARNVLLTAELCRLIDVMAREGIEAIPYKGPALALFAYKDVALRRFVDLDVMVRKEDVTKAIDLILSEGYELSKSLSVAQRQVLLRTQHNLQFRRYNRQLIVELHWEVASNLFASSVQAADLWRDLVVIDLNGAKVKSLAAEDLVFSLCVHGSRHLWERLLWICDVGWILVRHELDWEALLARSKATNTERMFLLGLHLCAKLLNVRLPASVLTQIDSDPQLNKLATAVTIGLFQGAEHRPLTAMQMLGFNLRVRKSWSSRARYFRHVLEPTDRDLGAIALPGPLIFGYYLMRPFRLLFKTDEDGR